MPVYEYICSLCKEKVEITASVAEKAKGLKPICPKCGNKKMIQVFGGFSFRSSVNQRYMLIWLVSISSI